MVSILRGNLHPDIASSQIGDCGIEYISDITCFCAAFSLVVLGVFSRDDSQLQSTKSEPDWQRAWQPYASFAAFCRESGRVYLGITIKCRAVHTELRLWRSCEVPSLRQLWCHLISRLATTCVCSQAAFLRIPCHDEDFMEYLSG